MCFKINIFLTILIVTHIFSSCSSNAEFKKNEDHSSQTLENSAITIEESILKNSSFSNFEQTWLEKFYKLNENLALWTKNNETEEEIYDFLNYLNSDAALNIPIGYFSSNSFASDENMILKEMKSLLRCAEYLHLKNQSIFNYEKNQLNETNFISPNQMFDFIQSKKESTNWIDHLIEYQEKNKRLIRLHFALNDFTYKYGIDHITTDKVYLKIPEDSLSQVFVSNQLYKHNFIGDTIIDTTELKNVLRKFQIINGLNPDAKLGKHTMNALSTSNYSRYLKGIIALDKMRALPDSSLVDKYVEVNIPSYVLSFYNNDSLINTSKVILGTQRNATPVFTSTMKYIVVNPYWNVPYSIASREILPHLKKDSSYLRRNQYELLDRDKNRIVADSIDWSKISSRNFPYFIRQKAGNHNSLGLVKLMFPNDKSIYIHDTPSKHLFNRDQRTFSHGCIRTENPFHLVNDILTLEKHPYKDSVEMYKTLNKETYLILKDTFPVNIVYRTAAYNDSMQQIQFFKDIYNKESDIYKLLAPPQKEVIIVQ